ncbi:MAG: 2Fe-2S iron-sulfur cluster binding domain-containing protein [Phycisphaerales bacterium]|nr:2Fe-2S iron-sulfur cluster binding domain-containing protein [Phycisphaerales bacterium]
MPKMTINGFELEFEKGQSIIDVALKNQIEIPHYCYHPGLSVPANCRICLAEISQPNHKTGALELIPKLMPTCHTAAAEGMVVTTLSPKAVANQRAVMEYLLINHPVDCAVCDQAGECGLQDYSYEYGRSQSRFQEDKIKNPKKDVGPNILLYSDRCIMCTRCVRFTKEVTQTSELMVDGRGGTEMIDIFPGVALDNELAGNVVDLCPVGALLDKDFLFQQRVWYLKKTPSIDGITASGDNVSIEHNEGVIYRIKPRENLEVNQWWITDEVRYGWKFVHSENRLKLPTVRGASALDGARPPAAWETAMNRAVEVLQAGARNGRIALLVSPMLACEEAFLLARAVLAIDPSAVLGVGPIPRSGEDRTLAGGFTICAEKAPNARGVRRVLEALAAAQPARRNTASTPMVCDSDAFIAALTTAGVGVVLITGNYPSAWVTEPFLRALSTRRIVLIDTLPNRLTDSAEVLLPAATWAEKSGCFENAKGRLQSFERAIQPIDFVKSESQIALDLATRLTGAPSAIFDAGAIRNEMAGVPGLALFADQVHHPAATHARTSDMVLIEL